MYKLTLIILLLSEFTLYSQKQINIVSTNNISLQDQKNIENIISNKLLISKLGTLNFTDFYESLCETYLYELNKHKNEDRNLLG